MEYKNALDFLLYSYFGFDGGLQEIKDNRNEISKYCAKRAYLDLARTVKFKYSTSKLDKMKTKKSTRNDKEEAGAFTKAKEDLINGICESMICAIDGKECNNNDFNEWHKNKCKSIKNEMNKATCKTNNSTINIINNKTFTIGQAQKWLNMTLKYLWLLNILPNGLDENHLHIPVDSYIIEAVSDKKHNYHYGLKLEISTPKSSWSSWNDYDEYLEFQKQVKKAITEKYTPLEWESLAWIEVAKNKTN